jgi:hypothetical protein
MEFSKWCNETEETVPKGTLRRFTADSSKLPAAVGLVAGRLPDFYARPDRVARVLSNMGKAQAAAYVKEKLPTLLTLRSGDLGEILCNAYVLEATAFNVGVKRLRWKESRNMAMRGEDVLACRRRRARCRLRPSGESTTFPLRTKAA